MGRLVLIRLIPDLYDIPADGQGEYRLVYELSPCLLLRADTGKEIHRKEDMLEPEPKRTPLPAFPSLQPAVRGVEQLASYFGLDEERYEREEKETEPGMLSVVWRHRDRKAPAVEDKTFGALV